MKTLSYLGLTAMMSLTLFSCSNSNNEPSFIKGGQVDVTLNLNGEAQDLRAPGAYKYDVRSSKVNGKVIESGYIVAHFAPGLEKSSFCAFDAICTNHNDGTKVAVEFSAKDLENGYSVIPFRCPICNIVYELGNASGAPILGDKGKNPLTPLRVELLNDHYLHITSFNNRAR